MRGIRIPGPVRPAQFFGVGRWSSIDQNAGGAHDVETGVTFPADPELSRHLYAAPRMPARGYAFPARLSANLIWRERDLAKGLQVSKEVRGRVIRDVFLAFVRVHVLHHAAKERIYGVEMMDELGRHGYDISPGTLYPLLHALEECGALASSPEVVDGKTRRYYRTTKAGDLLLRELRAKLRELFDELSEPQSRRMPRAAKIR